MPTQKTAEKKAETKTAEKKESKTAAVKKTTAKKTTTVSKKTEATEKKPEAETKVTKTSTAKAPKKTATKKTAAKKETAPVAEKTVEKKPAEAKASVSKAAAKTEASVEKKESETKKTVSKSTSATKKTTAKKTTVKKPAAKKTVTKKKAPAKKAAPKKSAKQANEEKLAQYNSFAIDTCLEMARAMGVNLDYEAYATMLLDNDDIKAMSKQLLDQFQVDAKAFSFEKDGYDTDLIEVIFQRIGDSVDIKASDFKKIAKEMEAALSYEIKDDATANNEEYQKDFDLVREILMIGQRKDIHSTQDLEALLHADPTDFIDGFMKLAYQVLPLFEYDDVKYYENFIYAVLSQFEDLHAKWGTRALMDVADLYIKHGDYGLGDANYNYVLRENEIKDMIYYRFASVYADIDLDKAKAIANSSFQFVDDRYDYYPKIIEILEK